MAPFVLHAQFGAPPQSGPAPQAQPLPLSGRQQSGSVVPAQLPQTGQGATSVSTINPSIQIQGVYQGSVPNGNVTSEPLSLTLQDAVRRGIQYNLGAISAAQAVRQARGLRESAAAQLLPDINGRIAETVQQINLAAEGFRFHVPGFNFPTVVGPFNYFDARGTFTESLSATGVRNWKSSRENARSAELSVQDSRDLISLAVAGSYLQLISSTARIKTAMAQIETAQAVLQQALDRNRNGLNARIDVNRSQVELQTQQLRLTSLQNDFDKQKISLARLIGLPMAQVFTLATAIPYREPPQPDIDLLIQQAWKERPDVKAAEAQVKAAQYARNAATGEYLPSIEISADYGAIGINPKTDARTTYTATGGVRIPIMRSGRIGADVTQADAALAQRKAEYGDAKGRAEQDVRNAVLDLNTAIQQLKVAESSRTLSADTVEQAQHRFSAGVADTIEVVQAQEAMATAEQDYITALYAFNLAKVALARAIGQTEQGVIRMLEAP